MLRNDGKVFELSGIHPYIWDEDTKDDLYTLFTDFFEDMVWFYHNTKEEYTKTLIENLVCYVVNYGRDDDIISSDTEIDYIESNFPNIDFSDCEYNNLDDAIELANGIDTEVNNEFLRVRISDRQYGGTNKNIYFRVSSDGFNWFNLIWKFVNDNKSYIDNVTIEKQNGQIYKSGRDSFDHIPVDDFLALPGNPIIENLH